MARSDTVRQVAVAALGRLHILARQILTVLRRALTGRAGAGTRRGTPFQHESERRPPVGSPD